MVQTKTQKTRSTQKKQAAKKAAPKKVTPKKTETAPKSTAVQVIEPNPVPVVIPCEKNKKSSPVRMIVAAVLFAVAVLVWFLFGQKVFVLVSQDMWLRDRAGLQAQAVTDEMVASVNGKPVFLSDVRTFAAGIPQLADLPFEMVYPQLLETIVDSKVLLTAAETAGTENRPDVQKKIKAARERILSDAYLADRLQNSVTDEQMTALYNQELADFKPTQEVHARHILVKTKKAAEDIIIQLKAGADFNLLAEKYSLDKQTPKGDLGYFSEAMMIPEFGKAAFALKAGQVSTPVKTPFGWHVIEVLDKRMSTAPTFDEIKDQLRQLAMEQNVGQVLRDEYQKQNVVIKKPTLQSKK